VAAELAFYSLNGDPRWACTPGHWVKVQEAQWIKACKDAGARVYYRPFLSGDDGGVLDAHAWAHDVWTSIVATGGAQPDAIIFRNEVWATEQTGRDYVTFYRDLRAAGYGGLIVLGSFADGEPDFPPGTTGGTWEALHAGLAGFVPDAYDVHCYFEDDPQGDVWHSLRHLQAVQRGELPAAARLFAGELGQTDGWKKKGWTAEAYAAKLLRWRDLAGPQMEVAWVFADDDTSGEWADFPIRGTAADAAVRSTWTGGPAVTTIGVDVSSNNTTPSQPDFDWVRVAQSGRQFAATKATQGTGYTNPTFARDWAELARVGMVRHTYHYDQPGVDPAAQARHFLATIGAFGHGDLPWLDIEDPGFAGAGDLSGRARAFFALVDGALGKPAAIYSYASFLEEHNLTPQTIGPRPLILAAYQQQWPQTPAGWPEIAIWQHTNSASVPGIPTLVDEDYTPLTRDQLVALGYQGGTPTVDPATQAAIDRFSALGVAPNTSGALFAAYKQRVQVWLANNKANVLDPTPAIRPEVNTGQDAYVALDCGEIYHWKSADGQVYLAEAKERDAIFKACGWAA